jgi:hypothetical protein
MPADDLAQDRPERSLEALLALIREHGAGVIRDHWVVRVPTNQPFVFVRMRIFDPDLDRAYSVIQQIHRSDPTTQEPR